MAEAMRVAVHGRDLRCQHCGHQEFFHKTAALDRRVLGGLVHLDGWFAHEAAIYVCGRCGFAHLFMPVPEAQHPSEQSPETERRVAEDACLFCGKPIPAEAARCPACGWSWQGEVVGTA